MIVIYKEGNWDFMRLENIVGINIIELGKLKEIFEKDIDTLDEIRKEFKKKSEIFGDFVFDILGKTIKEYSRLLQQINKGYNYVIFAYTTDGSSFSFYTKKLGKIDLIEKIVSKYPIEYVIIDADEGIIEIK